MALESWPSNFMFSTQINLSLTQTLKVHSRSADCISWLSSRSSSTEIYTIDDYQSKFFTCKTSMNGLKYRITSFAQIPKSLIEFRVEFEWKDFLWSPIEFADAGIIIKEFLSESIAKKVLKPSVHITRNASETNKKHSDRERERWIKRVEHLKTDVRETTFFSVLMWWSLEKYEIHNL